MLRKNYQFERMERARAKVAKREAKREARTAAKAERARIIAEGGTPPDELNFEVDPEATTEEIEDEDEDEA